MERNTICVVAVALKAVMILIILFSTTHSRVLSPLAGSSVGLGGCLCGEVTKAFILEKSESKWLPCTSQVMVTACIHLVFKLDNRAQKML